MIPKEERTMFVRAVGKVLREVLSGINDRLDALESNQKSFVYRGVFSDGELYRPGDFATFQGSMWHCNVETKEKPGDGPAWTLAVKRGRGR